jgi:hypothetical protein
MLPLPHLSRRVALVAALLLGPGVALAASPVGTWTLDEAALRDAIRQRMEAELAKLPPEKRA